MMTQAKEEYQTVGQQIEAGEPSQMFGKPCFKIGGKAFVAFFQDAMVFKLTGDVHRDALALEGAQLFDPSGKGRAMREWVQVPYSSKDLWPQLTKAACQYVGG